MAPAPPPPPPTATTAAAFAAVSDAVLAAASDLSVPVVLERLVAAARDLVSARYAALGVPDEEGTGFAQFVHLGMSDELVDAIGPLPRAHGLLGSLLNAPGPYRSEDVGADPRFSWWPDAHPRMRSFLGVPLVFKGDIVGAFYLADKQGADSFSADDEALVGVLAAHAAMALENARLYERSRELSIIEERNRMARELHDAMSQTLFSLSLTAGAAAAVVRSDPGRAGAELQTVQALAQAAVTELRSLVLDLRPPALEEDGLVATVAKHLDLVVRAHGIGVSLEAEGADGLPVEVEAQLFRVVQEALTNVVRHAGAGSVAVRIAGTAGRTTVTVTDDGTGFDLAARGTGTRRMGLTSIRERAVSLGGTATIESAPGAGTTVRVEVPRG